MKRKIYILHGWAYDTGKWGPFVRLLEKQGIAVVVLRVPGLTAPLEEVWELDDYVMWLAKELAGEKEKVVLLGHSNGGRIGLEYALAYPERVKQLILVDSAGIYHRDLGIRMKRLVFGSLAKVGKRLTQSERLRKVIYQLVRERDYERANPILRKTMANLISVDLAPRLSEISVPTTIIWGENDKITPISDGKIIHELIEVSTLHIIVGGRHSPMFTHAEEVAEIVTKEMSNY